MKLTDKEFKRRMNIATRPVTLSDKEFNKFVNNPSKCKKIVAENHAMHKKLSNIILKSLSEMWDVPFKKVKLK